MARRGLLIVMASIAAEKEEAFNRWYNEDHLPKVLERMPGVLSGRRYKIMEGEEKYQFMVMYEFESYEALEAATKQSKASHSSANIRAGRGMSVIHTCNRD
jgi:heme-degrading monooxygenase HmoA